MACPRPLLLLLSLVCSSGSFLMKTPPTQLSHTLPRGAGQSRDSASQLFQLHRGVLKQESQDVRNSYGKQPSTELARVGPLFIREVHQNNWKSFARFRRNFGDSADRLVDSQNAFRYTINKSSDNFSKGHERDTARNNVFQRSSWKNVFPGSSWNSGNPSKGGELRHGELGFRRPRDVFYSVNTDSGLHKRLKSSLEWLWKHMDKFAVHNKELDDETVGETKLWAPVTDLTAASQKLFADNDRSWRSIDNNEGNRESSLSFEPKAETPNDLNDSEMGQDGGFRGERSESMTESEQLWPKPVDASLQLHQPDQFTQLNRHASMGSVHVAKRFKVPLRKKVFVYGHDDRLRVFLPQMRKFPFSNIARLSTGCTGTLVTPRHVLTAAHCVHNGLGFRNNLEKLKIGIPDTMGFKDYYAHKITVPMGWLRENRSGRGRQSGKRAVYDYAVIRLKLAVVGRTKFLPLAVPRPEVLQRDFHFLAFPQDDQQLWRSSCLASQHMALGDGNLIMTRCDTAVGNSGAAVFIEDPQGGLRVVGILSNTMHVGYHRSFLRYSIITALTWPKLTHICNQLGSLGRKYKVCPPVHFMRHTPSPPNIKVVPFFGKRSHAPPRSKPKTQVL